MSGALALTGKRARKYAGWPHGFGVDSRGLTILRADPANRIILVTGAAVAADANRVEQVASLSAGLARVRAGFGDWLMLPAGGSTTEKISRSLEKSGKSAQYPTRVGVFDPADPYNQSKFDKGARFVFDQSADTSAAPVFAIWVAGGAKDIALRKLKFLATKEQAGQAAVSILAKTDRILFEACVIDGLNVQVQFSASTAGGTSIAAAADSEFNLDVTFHKCGLGYGNSKVDSRAGTFFASSTRRLRIIDCVDHHGGWSRGHTRTTQHWQYPTAVAVSSVSSSGTTATALTANTAGLVVGEYIRIAGVTPTSYNGYFTVAAVNPGVSVSYTFPGNGNAAATGAAITYIRPEINGYSYLAGSGPDQYKHGLYISDTCDRVIIIDTVSSWDASNPKLTGGNYYISNFVQIRAPMGFITDPNGNDTTESEWPQNSKIVVHNHLMVESADINDLDAADRRGWCAQLLAQGVGSEYAGGVNLRIATPSNGNRVGIDGDGNGSPGPSQVVVRDTVAIETGAHFVKANAAGAVTKSLQRMITDDTRTVAGASNVTRSASPAHMQAGITEALSRNVHTTLRTTVAELSSVSVGGNTLATELSVCDYMLENPEIGWAVKLAGHFRAPLGR